MNRKARVIAYYLPQFHPIPENDKWWGKGFTEWTNVGKARPLFNGHYQPRVPADLGYYDLRMPEVREAQAEMARNSGIEGFMYWHYWFGNGKTVLDRPFNEVLNSGKPDFPFCLGWANHSWTNKTWNSSKMLQKEKYIIEQTYPGTQDIIDHFNHVLPAFKDKRYITVEGKPVFVIYDPATLPFPSEFMNIWREMALKNDLKGIHFIALSGGWISNHQKNLDKGFDALNINGQWNAESLVKGKYAKMLRYKIISKFGGVVFDKYEYKDIIKHLFTELDKEKLFYPTIIPQWDRSARAGRKASIYHNSTPELFAQHVTEALDIISHKEFEHKILFLKSWNEWAEGNYIEPDIVFGHEYLDKLKEALTSF